MDTLNKYLDKLILEALCDEEKFGSVLILDNFAQSVDSDISHAVTTCSERKYFLMLIYEV